MVGALASICLGQQEEIPAPAAPGCLRGVIAVGEDTDQLSGKDAVKATLETSITPRLRTRTRRQP